MTFVFVKRITPLICNTSSAVGENTLTKLATTSSNRYALYLDEFVSRARCQLIALIIHNGRTLYCRECTAG